MTRDDDPLLVMLRASDLGAVVAAAVTAALAARRPAPPTPPTPLLSRRELAAALGVSPASLDRLTRQGMPRLMVGATPRYDLAAVREWLASRGAP
jgi:predicted DNA-binding transcriptional regulator AlpA